MSWLGAIDCGCGWTPDPTTEEDTVRICKKCDAVYVRKSWGWCIEKKGKQMGIFDQEYPWKKY